MRKTCSKCQATMVEGVVIDHKESRREASSWLEGAPVKGLIFGLKLRGKRPVPIQTYRCPRCGYLESYAPE